MRRIYIEEKLQVRRRGGRKRALGTKKPMVVPDGPNQRWSLDVVSDALPPLGILLRYILPGNGRTSFPHLGGC